MDTYRRINEIRVKKGITWKYLNENTPGKVYSSRMTELKNGKTTLSNEQIDAIANILETSTDYLLGNTDDPSPPGAEEKPTPVSESGLSEDQKFLIDTVIDMTSDEARRFRLIVEEVILRRGQ